METLHSLPIHTQFVPVPRIQVQGVQAQRRIGSMLLNRALLFYVVVEMKVHPWYAQPTQSRLSSLDLPRVMGLGLA